MKKFILSKNFPLFFLRSCSVLVLVSLFIALSLLNKYDFSGCYNCFVSARELIFSAAGIASVSLVAFYCFNQMNIHKK